MKRLFPDGRWLWSSEDLSGFAVHRGTVELIAMVDGQTSVLIALVEGPVFLRCSVHDEIELRARAVGVVAGEPSMQGTPWQPTLQQLLELARFCSERTEQRVDRVLALYARQKIAPQRTQGDLARACGVDLRSVGRAMHRRRRKEKHVRSLVREES